MVEKLELSLGSESVGPSGEFFGLRASNVRLSSVELKTQRLEMKGFRPPFLDGVERCRKGGRETVEPVSDVGCLKIRDRAQIRLSPACTSKGQPWASPVQPLMMLSFNWLRCNSTPTYLPVTAVLLWGRKTIPVFQWIPPGFAVSRKNWARPQIRFPFAIRVTGCNWGSQISLKTSVGAHAPL